MGNQYLKAFRRKILYLHLLVSASITVILPVLYYVGDYVLNGALINAVSHSLGWQTANRIMPYKSTFMVLFYLLCIALGFVFVEMYATSRFSRVILGMEKLLDKGQEPIRLPAEFSGLERELNRMKAESLEHERKARMEAQRKMDLITYLAHDIKTPLASVIGYLCLLDETQELPADLRKKYTGLTLEKAYRLESLINEFFDITRFNLSHIPLEKERIELPYMLAQMAEEFYPLLSRGGRKMELKTEEKLQIVADPDKLARVFNNILKNAIAYSYENTVILVEAYVREGKAVISFTNEGPVIPKEKLEQIFEKFFRLDPSRATSTGGSGLGLSIAREIVEQHGGKIRVTSENEKTKFTVELPVV